jgi:7,8-dihydroneopterin 2',3'-cyclic phosphate phosphodiesterase
MDLQVIRELVNLIKDDELKKIVEDVLNNPVLSFTNIKALIKLDESPAAPRKHHFFTGGLILHTYTVTKIALMLSEIFYEVYGIRADKDTVLATAVLHDIFKYYQYVPDKVNGGYKAREDWYLSHDYAIVAELSRRNAPDKLIRAITEVHGQTPFSTLEGLIVHLADTIDARIGEILQNIMLSKLRDYEKKCELYKVLDSLIKKHGVREIVSRALINDDEFKKIFENECRNTLNN